jgi:pimeloyl-ACP methyl ester carboxylesterase/DNA-binding CsgD family transcriptional regulator
VLVPPLAQQIEMMWEQPVFWRPIQRVASAFRFVQYDKLGTGLSDPVPDRATLDERLAELAAVLDAARIQHTWLLGFSEGGVIALAAAQRWPERIQGLILVSTYSGSAALADAAEYGAVPTREAYKRYFADVVARWGTSSTRTLEDFVPTLQALPALCAWVPRYERASASPAMIGRLMESGFALDATSLLPHVQQPALVIHLTADRVVPVAFARMLAARLPNAQLREFPGDDHFAWVSPNVDEIIDAIFEFTGVRGSAPRVSSVWNPWSSITPSEQRVVTLAQRGLSNAAIARTLSLSERTVENHLSRIYGKLGIRSRAELLLMKAGR